MRTTNKSIYHSVVSKSLEISLSTYKDSSVYYRAGDNFPENLKPIFVAISKTNKATVNEISSENNIINGNINKSIGHICGTYIYIDS